MQNMIWQKIEALQQEIVAFKNLSKDNSAKKAKKGARSLYGILKDVKMKISWKEFQEAKRVIFSRSGSHIK